MPFHVRNSSPFLSLSRALFLMCSLAVGVLAIPGCSLAQGLAVAQTQPDGREAGRIDGFVLPRTWAGFTLPRPLGGLVEVRPLSRGALVEPQHPPARGSGVGGAMARPR